MEDIVGDHLMRLTTAVLKKYTAASIAAWVVKNTTYSGQPYSYVDHEFQEKILSDTSRDVVITKCSQIGMSESGARMALALVNVLSPYTVAYTLPTAHFAGTFAKTRIDPVIEGSKAMKANVHRTNNSNEIKQFGDSFLYIRGASSTNAPISIPVDHLIHDEVDFSDQEVLGQYVSRLTHSKWKRTTKISTPTLPDFGISKAFQETRKHFNFCKCCHCGFHFIPNYYKHVEIPGFTGDIKTLTKYRLTQINYKDAVLVCPSCGLQPSLQIEHREWVCENPETSFAGAGYQITPFDAPNVISLPDLIEASTKYDRRQDFDNFSLGIAAEDSEATLVDGDFAGFFLDAEPPGSVSHVMGVDVGNDYHFIVAAVDPYGGTLFVHAERVPMARARIRYNELRQKWRVICTVIDSMPHAETVMALQAQDVNLYASVYMRSKSILTHNVVEKERDDEKGKDFVRQINVNRSRALDGYMEAIRGGSIHAISGPESELMKLHHKSMKRVKVYDNESSEMMYSWEKTDGHDHYHHTGLYAWLAGKIRGVGKTLIILPTSSIFKFRLKPALT